MKRKKREVAAYNGPWLLIHEALLRSPSEASTYMHVQITYPLPILIITETVLYLLEI